MSSCLGHSRELRFAKFYVYLQALYKVFLACTTPFKLLMDLCRVEALQNQHRAVRLMHLQAEATALEAEAATWELLLHMYAETHRTYPAGTGGQQTAIKTVSFHCSMSKL